MICKQLKCEYKMAISNIKNHFFNYIKGKITISLLASIFVVSNQSLDCEPYNILFFFLWFITLKDLLCIETLCLMARKYISLIFSKQQETKAH